MQILLYFCSDFNKTFQKEIVLKNIYFEQVLLCDSVKTIDFEEVLLIMSCEL